MFYWIEQLIVKGENFVEEMFLEFLGFMSISAFVSRAKTFKNALIWTVSNVPKMEDLHHFKISLQKSDRWICELWVMHAICFKKIGSCSESSPAGNFVSKTSIYKHFSQHATTKSFTHCWQNTRYSKTTTKQQTCSDLWPDQSQRSQTYETWTWG